MNAPGGQQYDRIGSPMIAADFDTALRAAISGKLGAGEFSALGIAATELRREADALPILTAAAERTRNDPSLWHVLGLMHRALGDLAPALAAFDKALALPAPTPILLHAKAHTAREAGLPAAEFYRSARAASPNDGDMILGEAAALADEGAADDADNLLTATLRAHPGWMPGHAALIKLRCLRRRPDRFAAIDEAIASFPGDWRFHQLKIVVLLRAEEGDAAQAALSKAYATCGRVEPLHILGAMIATEFGRPADADAAFAACGDNDDPHLTVFRLRHLLRRGEPERIVAPFAGNLSAVPQAAWPYLSVAWRMLGDRRAIWLDDPRLVKDVDLKLDSKTLNLLATTLRSLHRAGGQPVDQSVRGGSQTDGPLFSRLDLSIRTIRDQCRNAVEAYIAALPPHDAAHPLLGRVPATPRFVGSWSVRLVGEGYHVPHVHTEGWLSSALYVSVPDVPEGTDAGALALGAPQPSLGTALPPDRIVRPRPARLVLFPSTLWHGTLPFPHGERLTVAFDIG